MGFHYIVTYFVYITEWVSWLCGTWEDPPDYHRECNNDVHK